MSTKTKTSQKSNQTTTAAPPDWTAGPIKDLAGQIMPALTEAQAVGPYTGDFNAGYRDNLLANTLQGYQQAAGKGVETAGWLEQQAKTMPKASFGTGTIANPFEINQGPAVGDLSSILGGGAAGAGAPTYQGATILDMPDYQSMAPTMTAAPSFVDWNPNAFQADDGGARLDAALEAATQPFVRELMTKILPGIKSSALEAGAYSGDRAMSVLPTQAIADTAGRANEVTQGLAYQGFQSEEQRRLQAWQAFEAMTGQAAGAENDFNTGIWQGTNDFNRSIFDTIAGNTTSAYGTKQNALTADAQGANAFGLDRYGIDTNAALEREGMLQDQYQNWVQNMLGMGAMQNQGFGLETQRGATAIDAELASRAAASGDMLSALQAQTGSADINALIMQIMQENDQTGLNNAIAKNDYAVQQPFVGMDIATQLLTGLSGNWGTTNSNGTSESVTKTSGLGPIMQGIMGAGMAAAGMGAFGGAGAAGGALGSATKFAPISGSIFGGGAQAGMKA